MVKKFEISNNIRRLRFFANEMTQQELAEKAGKLLEQMVPAIRKTADLVQEVSAASQEQSVGVNQVSKAMGTVDQVTQRNASAAEELSSTAEEMSSQAEALLQTRDGYLWIGTQEAGVARFGEPVEIARAVAFLASPAAGYITGSELHVNGGMFMN